MEELIKLLFAAAQERARLKNYKFDALAENDLKNFIRTGVNRMTSLEINSITSRALAEKNLMELIDLMIKDAGTRFINESLDTRTFSNSRASLCPRWPFC